MQQVLEDFCGRTLTDTKEPLKTLPNYITTKFKTEPDCMPAPLVLGLTVYELTYKKEEAPPSPFG